MNRNLFWQLAVIGISLGACLSAGTIRQAYPDFGYLQPLFAYIGGFAAAVALFVKPPHPDGRGQGPP